MAFPFIQNFVGIEYSSMNNDEQEDAGTHLHFRKASGRAKRVLPVLFFGVALALAACSSAGSAKSPSASSGSGASSAVSITIHNFAFSPDSINVAPGATVTVTNKDQVTHTLTATKGTFTTGDISAGQSKTFAAPKTPGTYSYICSIHQYMTGTLVVSS